MGGASSRVFSWVLLVASRLDAGWMRQACLALRPHAKLEQVYR